MTEPASTPPLPAPALEPVAAPTPEPVKLPAPDAWPVYYRRRTVCGFLAPTTRDGKRAYRAWFEDGKPVPIRPYKDRRHGETCLRNSFHLRIGNP